MLTLLFACTTQDSDPKETGSTDSSDTEDTEDSFVTDTSIEVSVDGECPQETRWGGFVVEANDDYAYVTGSVRDGIVPMEVLSIGLVSGDCIVYKKENPFCDPGCDPDETCNFDGECVPYPVEQDLGTVAVGGLLEAVSMEPVTPGYNYFDTSLPNPPWEPGATITLQTGGGVYEPVTLHAYGLDAFVVPDLEWQVADGVDLIVSWDAPVTETRSEVELTLNIDQHGITPSTAVCIFADDGEGTVPSDITENLFALGVSGFPSGTLTRRTVDSGEVGEGGCMEMASTITKVASIDVAGYTPCVDDDDCPTGMECNEAIQLCE